MALGQQANDKVAKHTEILDNTVAILNGFCDGCIMGRTCISQCNRMNTLSKLVNTYDILAQSYFKLEEAYDIACAELTLGSQYFMNNTKEEVKEHFLNG